MPKDRMSKREILIKKMVYDELTILAYTMFLNDNDLLDKAREFALGFANCFKEQEITAFYAKANETLEQAYKDDEFN